MPAERSIDEGIAGPGNISTRQEFAAGLTVLRERAGLTVRDVAQRTGIPASTIGGYFGGRHVPPLKPADQLRKILAACGVDEAAAIENWLAVLARVRRAPGRRPATAPVPYRGLASFQSDDADWFFGRERLTGLLVGALRACCRDGGLLAVVGPSGSGKSSLLRAGLIPALRAGALDLPGSGDWPTVLFTPGARPTAALSAQLAAVNGGGARQAEGARPADDAHADETARENATAHTDQGDRRVIVVDQFEEIFTSGADEDERRAFIAALHAVAGDGTALVVVGLRADFYPHALRYPELVSALQRQQFIVGPMSAHELRSAITGPARQAGLDVEDGLVEVLLRDLAPAAGRNRPAAAHDPGALPLLSHALLVTWEQSHGRLTVAGYRDSGGIDGAVAVSAEEVYAGLAPGQQELARRMFTRLVRVADDTADTRRRVPRGDLVPRTEPGPDGRAGTGSGGGDGSSASHGADDGEAGDADRVLDAFIAKRLITVGTDGTDQVEIAHEALLWAWPRLRQWLDGDGAATRARRELTAAAEAWRDSGREPGALYRGARLAAAQEWAAEPPHAADLNPLEREFLAASTGQRLAAERAARRRAGRLTGLAAALAALAVAAVTLAVVAYRQRDAAADQRDVAVAGQVATEADELRGTDPDLAMQLALAAYRISPTTEALSSLLDSTAGPAVSRMLGTAGTEVSSVALSPDGRLLAAGSDTGMVRVWNVSRPGHPVPLGAALDPAAGHGAGGAASGATASVAFGQDGRLLVAGGADGAVSLWSVADAGRPVLLDRVSAGAAAVSAVAYGGRGRAATLVAASADGQVWLWNAASSRRLVPLGAPLKAGAGPLNAAALSPDADLLTAGGGNGRIRLWARARPGGPFTAAAFLRGPADGVNAVAFSPDNRTLAAAGNDSKVWLWTLNRAVRKITARPPLTGPRSWIYSLAFNPAGNAIAAGSADNNAYLWTLPNGALSATLPHPAPVLAVAWGAEGTLATGDEDGTARIWRLPGPVITAPSGSVFTVAFSPGGAGGPASGTASPVSDLLAVASAPTGGHGAVQLWETARTARPTPLGPPLTAPGGLDGTAGFGAGGRLAAGGGNGAVYLWDVRAQQRPVSLRSPATALTSAIQYVAFDRDGGLMAAGSTAGTVELWDTADFPRTTPLAVIAADTAGPASYRDVFAIAFSANGKILATAAADGTVRLWDIARPSRPRPLGQPLTRLGVAVYQVSFSPSGGILAASGADGKVRLWDVTDPGHPRLLSTLSGPAGSIVYDVAFSPDGRTLAAADGGKTVALWDIADPGRPAGLGSLTGPTGTVFSVAFSPDGSSIAAGSQDGTTRLWIATPTAAAAYVCTTAGDPVTAAEWAQYVPELPYDPPCGAG